MREPVFPGIAGHAFRFAVVRTGTLRRESPDVPSTRAIAIDVDPFSVGRVVRTVVKARARSKPLLFAAGRGNTVDVEISATLSNKSQPSPVGRPAVEIAGNIRGDH